MAQKTTEKFIEQAKAVHGNRYDYSNTIYIHWSEKINIVCKKHGEISIRPNDHLQGYNCKLCAIEGRTNDKEGFLRNAFEAHGDLYDYSQVVYKSNKKKVDIICPIHGIFKFPIAV